MIFARIEREYCTKWQCRSLLFIVRHNFLGKNVAKVIKDLGEMLEKRFEGVTGTPMEVSWLLRLETKGASCTISKADCFRKYSCSYSGFEPIRKFLSCKIKSALIILLATWNEMFQFISRQVDSVEGSRIVLIFALFVNWILGANAIFNPSQNASPSAILSMHFINVNTKMLIMSFSCETCLIVSLWLPANLRHFSFLWIVNVCSVCKVFTCLPRAKVCYH